MPVLWEIWCSPEVVQVSAVVPHTTSLSHRGHEAFQVKSLVGQHNSSSCVVLSPGPGLWVPLGSFISYFSLLQSPGLSLGLLSLASLSYIPEISPHVTLGHPQLQDWVENNIFLTDLWCLTSGCCCLRSSQSALLEASRKVCSFHSGQ